MQRLPLLFLAVMFIISLQASFKKDDDWVTIMETKEGVIVQSDPESAGELPKIEESYYPLRPKTYAVINTKEYTITKFVDDKNLTKLIIEEYLGEHSKIRTVGKDKIAIRVLEAIRKK